MSKAFQLSIIVFCIFFGFTACKHVKPEPPEPSSLDSLMEVPTSVLNIPIVYDVRDMQEWLNKKIYGTFVNQGIKINDDKDSLYLSIRKFAPIRLWWRKSKLYYEVPLELSATYFKKIGNRMIHNSKPVVTQVVLKLHSTVDFDRDWNLVTKSELHTVEWRQEPELRLGRIVIPIKSPINKYLRENKDSLMTIMDQAIYEQLDVKKVINKLWGDIQKTLYIRKDKPEIFLKSRASAVEGGIIGNVNDKIILDLTLYTQASMSLEAAYLPPKNDDIPFFKHKSKKADDFDIAIFGIVSFKKINELVNEFLKNKEVEVKGYKAKIKEVEVYGHKQSLVLKLTTKGDLRGTLYGLGELHYDAESEEFYISNFRYDLDTEDQLVQTAHIFLKERILDEVKNHLTFDVSTFLDELPAKISTAIDEGKSGDALNLTIDELKVVEWSSLITADNLQYVLRAKGKAQIELKELKKGKDVKIGNLANLSE